MTFYRVSGNPNQVLPNAAPGDRALDDQGYLWWRSSTLIAEETLEALFRRGPKAWIIERRITTGKLLDVQGEPTLAPGSGRRCCRDAKGKVLGQASWRLAVPEEELGDVCERLVKTDSLIVLGNLSLPIVDGRIPVYHPVKTNQIVCWIKCEPIN